jgi:hypothetical protein
MSHAVGESIGEPKWAYKRRAPRSSSIAKALNTLSRVTWKARISESNWNFIE